MDDPLIGRILKDTYRIDKALTDGGMSLVYLAWQISLSRPVVLKLLRPGFNDQEFIDLFLREARISSQINHPNVVSVFDFGQTEDDIVYLAMELLEGETLGDVIAENGPLPLSKTLWLMEQICNGMHAAHDQSVVHRDLKPHNLMISRVSGDDTIVKVLDFGISKPLSEDDLKHTRMGMVMGTPGYLAPEQIQGHRQIDQGADVYALGAILYFCLTGVAPFKGANREIIMNKQLEGTPEPLSSFEHLSGTALKLQPIIDKAMQLERADRYASVRDLWNDLYSIGVQNAVDSRSIPTEIIAGGVTQYQFLLTGEKAQSFNDQKAFQALSKITKLNEKQWQRFTSGKRVVVRKNLPLKDANRYKAIFEKVGLLGDIAEMPNATRIAPRNDTSMTGTSAMEPVTLSDIKTLNQSKKVERYQKDIKDKLSSGVEAPGDTVFSARSSKRSKNKTKWLIGGLVSLMLFSLATWLYKPLHYRMHDLWVYSIQGKEDARGVSPELIKIGLSGAFQGSARELGRSMRVGIAAYFDAINAQGGIHGRQLELVSKNDSYEPAQAVANIKEFTDPDNGVLAMLGNVGTPTAKAMLPIALETNTIIFGTFSGASLLRNNPPDRYVFNYRASYAEETEAIVHHFVKTLNLDPSKIGIFHQNDSFGEDGASGVLKALSEYNITSDMVLKSVYERNTAQVDQAVFEFSAEYDTLGAIVIVGTYSASAAFIREMREMGYEGQFANVSFVGARALSELLLEFGPQFVDGIFVTQVVPMYNSYATGVLEYREDLAQFYPNEEPNFVSLEGYIAAKIFCEALIRSGRYFTQEELVDKLETIKGLDLGIGSVISFSPSSHQASRQVWGTTINRDGSFEQVDL